MEKNSGMDIASTTSDTLSKIVENVAEISGLISSISKSSSKQADSLRTALSMFEIAKR